MSEHFGEHLVNTLVNTFLREVNTLKSLRIYTRFFISSSVILVKSYIIYIRVRTCVYVRKVFIVFINRDKVFTKPFTNCSPNYTFLEMI